jgi:hypothetical protein
MEMSIDGKEIKSIGSWKLGDSMDAGNGWKLPRGADLLFPSKFKTEKDMSPSGIDLKKGDPIRLYHNDDDCLMATIDRIENSPDGVKTVYFKIQTAPKE